MADKDQSGSDQSGKKLDQSGKKREIGEGMHSLDSTQAPLKSENAEVDWDAKNGRVNRDDVDKDSSSSDSNR